MVGRLSWIVARQSRRSRCVRRTHGSTMAWGRGADGRMLASRRSVREESWNPSFPCGPHPPAGDGTGGSSHSPLVLQRACWSAPAFAQVPRQAEVDAAEAAYDQAVADARANIPDSKAMKDAEDALDAAARAMTDAEDAAGAAKAAGKGAARARKAADDGHKAEAEQNETPTRHGRRKPARPTRSARKNTAKRSEGAVPRGSRFSVWSKI